MLILVFHSCEKDVQKAIVKVDDEVIRLSTFKDQYQGYMANTLQSDNLLTRYSFLNILVDEKLILKYEK